MAASHAALIAQGLAHHRAGRLDQAAASFRSATESEARAPPRLGGCWA